MMQPGTHMLCGKASLKADTFTVAAMGTEWSQRSVSITNPVSYNKLDMTGVDPDGGSGI